MRRLSYEELSEAFSRQGIRLQQTEQKLALAMDHISQLESVVIKARNALTPRGMVKLSSEQEPTI